MGNAQTTKIKTSRCPVESSEEVVDDTKFTISQAAGNGDGNQVRECARACPGLGIHSTWSESPTVASTPSSSNVPQKDLSRNFQAYDEDNKVLCTSDHTCPGIPTAPLSNIYRMRADYVPHQAANSEHVSYATGGHFSTKATNKATPPNASNHLHRDELNPGTNTIVVMPSIDLDATELKRMGTVVEYYEERQLYHLFLIVRDTSFRIIFVSTLQLDKDTIRYYLSIDGCSQADLDERLSRLYLLNPEEGVGCGSCPSLTRKVINSEKLMRNIRNIIDNVSGGDHPTAGISFFCASDIGDKIASRLCLRSLEASGRDLYYGSKQGSREMFHFCDVPCSPGTPDFGDEDLLSVPNSGNTWSLNHRFICEPRSLAIGIARQIVLKNVKPKKWVVKLNQGFSGRGNASLDIQDIQNKVYEDSFGKVLVGDTLVRVMANDIERAFSKMKFVCSDNSWHGDCRHIGFVDQVARLGVIAEAFVEGMVVTSPSVQAIIDPDMNYECQVKILSTHEQVLNGQIYRGCINPAKEEYRSLIVEYTMKLGRGLAKQGVVGHFSADFLATRTFDGNAENWTVTAIEINLRQGGTTHPYSAMALLCGGHTGADGIFRTIEGNERFYEATDNYIHHSLDGMNSSDFLRIFLGRKSELGIHNLQWDERSKVGVVFHLLPFLQKGKIGFTAIAETSERAKSLFEDATKMMEDIAEKRKNGNLSKQL